MSYLAQRSGQRCGSGEIAVARSLSQTLTAKLLTQLAAAHMIKGQPGPGGGYMLTIPPEEISLLKIIALFEPIEIDFPCPLGLNCCLAKEPCPLLNELRQRVDSYRCFLEDTPLSVFSQEIPETFKNQDCQPLCC